MVVAVVDEGIGDGMSVAGVELLHEGLGCLFLLEAELVDEALCLDFPKAAHFAEVKVRGDGLDGVELIGTDRCFSRLPIGSVDGDGEPIVADPFLGRHRDTGMSLCHTGMAAVDIGVGEPSTRNPHSGSASSGSESVVGASAPDTQGGAFLSDIPANTGEESDRSSKTKKTHKRKKRGLGKTELDCRRQPREFSEGRALWAQASSNPCVKVVRLMSVRLLGRGG